MNEYGQPVGDPLRNWKQPVRPPHEPLVGASVRLEPLSVRTHTGDLWSALCDADKSLWTYMPVGPFTGEDDLRSAIVGMVGSADLVPYAICVDGHACGFASFLRVDPPTGVIEIGYITLAPSLQRSIAATEAIYLMIDHVFELGYRRCEWKCDDLNAPSRTAAIRFGFTYEGTFRSATHYKGRNRDTAWFAIIDSEWPALREGFVAWLASDNFDDSGIQKVRLHDHRRQDV